MGVINEDYMAQVRDIIEVYCERLALRMDVMAAQVHCPLDVLEHVGGVVYAAPFFDNSPELAKIRAMFVHKYGRIDIDGVKRHLIDERVHPPHWPPLTPQLLDLLQRTPPSELLVDFYLGTIAGQFEIEWTPPLLPLSMTEELELAPPDLLGGAEGGQGEDEGADYDVVGTLSEDEAGHTWVSEGASTVPIFIPPSARLGATPGTLVGVVLDARGDGKRSGQVAAHLPPHGPPPGWRRHGGGRTTGQLSQDKKGHAWVATNLGRVFVAPIDLGGVDPRVGGLVHLRLHEREDGKRSGVVLGPHHPAPTPALTPSLTPSLTPTASHLPPPAEGILGTIKRGPPLPPPPPPLTPQMREATTGCCPLPPPPPPPSLWPPLTSGQPQTGAR